MKKYTYILLALSFCLACENRSADIDHHDDDMEEITEVTFTARQVERMQIETGPMEKRPISSSISVNGILEVPPQHEAIITSIVNAHVSGITLIEGDRVKKGQVLAYLSHPDIIRLQSDYLDTYHRLALAEQELNRQQRLMEEEVGAGKTLQQTQANYRGLQATLSSKEGQLRLLDISTKQVQEGNLADRVAIRSPLDGSITAVHVKNGQSVQPETALMELINTDHIHIKLLVYEKDISRIQIGQEVSFRLRNGDRDRKAEVFSISQKFEQDSRALQVHAEIEGEHEGLVPGMYVKAQIIAAGDSALALPDAALVREGEMHYIFEKLEDAGGSLSFKAVPVETLGSFGGWTGVRLEEADAAPNRHFALNNGYHIWSEMKKGEVEDDH
ncbi:efflux RND transporter periplasmic adaptor subunit [Litoribacter ruber]|uniref:efflux RND transporter periplasmic adaptor subunit n=1 Tax=Litoribacter ruber TaxID=702568 RepID=UPI001BD958B4|nr:efflux RND transporter periplasmic adaptor subunit [Litoribacter ruber]MBT0809695.1 efflux RND transporter periplasmic adaptor subunit [Litoribacter ruber]